MQASKKEHRGVIRLLATKGVGGREIHRRMKAVYVLDNRRITMDEIHRLLGISVGGSHTIMHQHSNFRKICAQWVSNQLTAE
ncbi:uncharacterized protein TNCV_3100341 [Trichonephila clavipes]|nr:uncharacterized protein TNCV_3100341 [Trichonephila clavipes]